MRAARLAIGLSALCAASLLVVAAYAQDSHDCRRVPERDLLSGRWRDDGNGKLVDISGNVKATYVEANQCKFPDSAGDVVPLPTDFEGTASGFSVLSIDASMYYCTFARRRNPYDLCLLEWIFRNGEPGWQSITGTFSSPDGPQPVHLTRVSKFEKPKRDDSNQTEFVYFPGVYATM